MEREGSQVHKELDDAKIFEVGELLTMIDRALLQNIEHIYRMKAEGLDPLEFIRFFMNCIQHRECQSPYLASGLSELFAKVSKGQGKIKFNQLTDHICEKIVDGEGISKELCAKWVPIMGRDENRQSYLQSVPTVSGRTNQVCKVWLDKQLLDNGKHEDLITTACYSVSRNRIYSLESLSDWIGIYTTDARIQSKLRPSSFKVKKDSSVIGICFSEREERLGAVLKDFSLSFWDAADGYSFQKSISTTKYFQDLQHGIWYLQFFQKWITTDIDGKLNIWNLVEQCPQKIIKCRQRSKVNDICQIPGLFVIAVAQEQRGAPQSVKIQLISLKNHQIVAEVDTRFQRRMLHTIRYSEEYQVLLSAGYEKKINLFQIDSRYLDSWLRGELLGHQSAISCFDLIRNTPMVVSADDRGKVKVWNIKNFKCLQTFDFTDKVTITRVLDMAKEKKIALMGSRVILLNLESRPETIQKVQPIRVRATTEGLMVFSDQDIRRIDESNGKITDINYQFSRDRLNVTAILITSKGEIVVGNEKGELVFYEKRDKEVQRESWHDGSIQFLEEDVERGMILTYSDGSGFIVVGKVSGESWEEVRQLRGHFTGIQLNSIVFSSYHGLIGFVLGQSVFVCDYQKLKIVSKIDSNENLPTSIAFANGLQMALVGTSTGDVLVYELVKEGVQLKLSVRCGSQTVRHLVVDMKYKKLANKLLLDSCVMYCGFSDGEIKQVNLSQWASGLTFKDSKGGQFYNPHRQIRQNFDLQLKKMDSEYENGRTGNQIFKGEIVDLKGHSGGLTSLYVAELEQHILISTGKDQRVKLWRESQLVGDININLPLPYLWEVNLRWDHSDKRRKMLGLEIIQLLYARFGKDISIGQSNMFKTLPFQLLTEKVSFLTALPNKAAKLKRKPTLFQQRFSTVDLNYEKIKKDRILPVMGPSLKRMQLTKKVNTLQRQFQAAKLKEQDEKKQLQQQIKEKAQRNEEKDTIVNLLMNKKNPYISEVKEEIAGVKALEKKLDDSVRFKELNNASATWNQVFRSTKGGKTTLPSNSLRKTKIQKISNSKVTLETYFNQKFSQGRLTAQTSKGSRSGQQTPRLSQQQNSLYQMSQGLYRKNNNFRIMMREMHQKLSKCKNGAHSNEQPIGTNHSVQYGRVKQSAQIFGQLEKVPLNRSQFR